MLIVFHFALAPSLHALYDAQAVGRKIHAVQATGKEVAVYPARLADQFQFAGRLTNPVLAQKTIKDIAFWAQAHKEQYVLLLLRKKETQFFADNGAVQPFANKWLIFRFTDGIFADYQRWKADRLSTKR